MRPQYGANLSAEQEHYRNNSNKVWMKNGELTEVVNYL